MAMQLIMPTAPMLPDHQALRIYHSTNQLYHDPEPEQLRRYNHNRSISSSSSSNYYQAPTMPRQHPSLLPTPTTSATDLASNLTSAASSRRPSTTSNTPHPSPLISTGPFFSTSTSTPAQSPTSPRSSYHARQIRPLYIPAVLRPTEFSSKTPKSPGKYDDECAVVDSRRLSTTSFMTLAGLSTIGQKLGRRPTRDSLESALAELDRELFPKVVARPTRKHWKLDTESTACDELSCLRAFSYLNRRHHCRKCGNIFCDSHSASTVPLDEDAKFNPRGTPSRACAHCHREYTSWRSRNNSLSSSVTSSTDTPMFSTPAPLSMPPTPTMTVPGMAIPTGTTPPSSVGGDSTDSTSVAELVPDFEPSSVAASMPRNWNWSTF